MISCPAFVLGNGPSLPVDALALLSDRFTVGVNRILRSGFVPDVIVWTDPETYTEEMDASGSMLVCTKYCKIFGHHHGLEILPTDKYRHNPAILQSSGNTGICAALWALSLGCSHVYLLGMEGSPGATGVSNFFGNQRPADSNVYHVFGRELLKLDVWFPDRHTHVVDGEHLKYIVATTRPIDKTKTLDAILRSMRAGGAKI